ncbi:MAG: tRNA glutamyl-Q(34) synthetase GluQRS [Acidimicrobiales bacterium]
MRGRFAPSPTGPLHLGNLRTGLVAWLFARSAGSTFSLRFEDLDSSVVRPEHYDGQRRDMAALGLDWDDELCQSEHVDRYRVALETLTAAGLTYPCYCSRREVREAASAPHQNAPDGAYPGTCRDLTVSERQEREAEGRKPALRLRTDQQEASFVDVVFGETTALLDDMVLARRDGTPAYNLAVVVDDAHQGIEQVVRADDLLASTPRQLHLGRLLGVPEPSFAHVPLVLGPDGSRLAKRDGAVTLAERLELGESAEQVRSYLAASIGLIDWNERPTPRELVARFDPSRLSRQPWRMDSAAVAPNLTGDQPERN